MLVGPGWAGVAGKPSPGSEAPDPAGVLCIQMGLRARSDEVWAGDPAKLAAQLKQHKRWFLRFMMILLLLLTASFPWSGLD